MAERSAKIEGARAEAAAVEAAARQDLENYNAALRKAQGEIYLEQEEARQAVLDERAKNLKAQRSRVASSQAKILHAAERANEFANHARMEVRCPSAAVPDYFSRAGCRAGIRARRGSVARRFHGGLGFSLAELRAGLWRYRLLHCEIRGAGVSL